jgi:hypothetical protein
VKAFEAEPRRLCLSVFIRFVWGVTGAHGCQETGKIEDNGKKSPDEIRKHWEQ